jgi:hypothetical protein
MELQCLDRSHRRTNKSCTSLLDPAKKRVGAGHRLTRRIRNTMDESEATEIEMCCNSCDNNGLTYKKCPVNKHPTTVEVGSSINLCDMGAPKRFLRQQEADHDHDDLCYHELLDLEVASTYRESKFIV